jgi:hypothetical protein
MKLDTKNNIKDEVSIVKEAKKDIQKILIGSIKPKKNHILFEINVKEKTIEFAKFDKTPTINYLDIMQDKHLAKKNKVTKKENCIYISALNNKNALKILKREFNIEL